jgi:hypothetical protein
MCKADRISLVVLIAVCATGVLGVIVAAALDERRLAFTLGVQPGQVVAVLQPDQTACQGPIAVPADARQVVFPAATGSPHESPLLVLVRTASGVAGRATAPAGDSDRKIVNASPAGLKKGSEVSVCIRNAGSSPVALYGGPAQASRASSLALNGRDTRTDLSLVFERSEPRSMLSALPDAIERATLFKAGWVSEALLCGLAVMLVTVVPAVLVAALRAALREPGTGTSYSSRP